MKSKNRKTLLSYLVTTILLLAYNPVHADDGYRVAVADTNYIVGERVLSEWIAPLETFRSGDQIRMRSEKSGSYYYGYWLPGPAGAYIFTMDTPGQFYVYYYRYGFGITTTRSETVYVRSPVRATSTIKNWPPPDPRFILFGDDIAAGVGGGPSNRFVSSLSTSLEVPVINAGNTNDTSRSALNRLQTIVNTGKPGTILICIRGANDYASGIPPYETVGNIHAMVQTAENAGWVTVLIGVGDNCFCSDGSGLHHISQETGVVYLPNILDLLANSQDYSRDGILPTAAGYDAIVERMLPTILPLVRQLPAEIKLQRTQTGHELAWDSKTNRTYIIEWTPTLETPQWRPLAQCTGTGNTFHFPISTTGTSRFFRLILVP